MTVGGGGRPPTPTGPVGGNRPPTPGAPTGPGQRRARPTASPMPAIQALWNRAFPNQSSYVVTNATHLGKDANGNTIYGVTVRTTWGTTSTHTYAVSGGKFVPPQLSGGIQQPGGATSGGERNDAGLQSEKDRALKWIATYTDWMSAQQALAYTTQIRNFSGDRADFLRMFETIRQTVGAQGNQLAAPEFVPGGTGFDLGGGGGGGGFGGGLSGPQYVEPDRRVVEDFVKGTMVSLIGTVSEEDLDRIVDIYMADHRKDFDTVDKQIDPQQSVVEAIRGTAQYKRIHQLRPDSEDERTWIAQRQKAAQEGGLTTGLQEDFAIDQATVGGDVADVADAASLAQFRASGSTRNTLLDTKVRGVIENMFARVR